MRTRIFASLLLMTSLLLPITSAQAADWIQYQTGPADTYNRSDLTADYDITRVDFGVNDSKPNEYWFFLIFAKPITANMFSDKQGSWAGIFLDTNNDGELDYSLETDSTPFEGNYFKKGLLEDRTSGEPVESTRCNVQNWTNLDTKANWIGFSMGKSCLPLGSTVGVLGYSDRISSDNAQYDYAPESIWSLNLEGGAVTNPGNSTSTTIPGQLPSVNIFGESVVTSPANQPDDLVTLAANTTKSVVTVFCSDGLGSGWSINADLSAANISNGYKSYIITNHHVIAKCKEDRDIYLLLSDQTKVSAYVYAWDEANDVAGILTSTQIPKLNWRGVTPQQGWWVGVLGSPLGFPGILTTGIISSVNSTTFLGTTSAAINHGNSGGPVFDRSGRVIGLATAFYAEAQSFGIFNGTPLLCNKIVNCTSTTQIWQGSVSPTPVATPEPTPVATLTPDPTPSPTAKKAQTITVTSAPKDLPLNSMYNYLPIRVTSNLPVDVLVSTPKICEYSEGVFVLLAVGTCRSTINQAGNEIWEPAKPVNVVFKVLAIAKKTTITCVKGKITKKITAVKPVCPTGYKKKK